MVELEKVVITRWSGYGAELSLGTAAMAVVAMARVSDTLFFITPQVEASAHTHAYSLHWSP